MHENSPKVSGEKLEKVLITGANGFVGSHTAELFFSKGVFTRALVRNIEKSSQILSSITDSIVQGDLSDSASLKEATEGVDSVIHIAAAFREAKLSDNQYFEVNVGGTKRLLDAAITNGVKRFIYCSTNGVHGDVKDPPADENSPIAPCDVYQESKVEAEKLVQSYFESGKIAGHIIRPAMIYGPGDTRLGKIFTMIKKERFFYVGKGDAWCHFIDVRDLANSFYLAHKQTEINAQTYLIAGERPIRLNDFCNFVADEWHVKRPWVHLPLVPMQLAGDLCEILCKPLGIEPPLHRRRVDFYIKNRSFIIDKAKQELGFEPARNLEDEIRDILRCF